MKVFEKIATKGESREEVYERLLEDGIHPCDLDEEYKLVSDEKIKEFENGECDFECYECLNKFLNMEVAEW